MSHPDWGIGGLSGLFTWGGSSEAPGRRDRSFGSRTDRFSIIARPGRHGTLLVQVHQRRDRMVRELVNTDQWRGEDGVCSVLYSTGTYIHVWTGLYVSYSTPYMYCTVLSTVQYKLRSVPAILIQAYSVLVLLWRALNSGFSEFSARHSSTSTVQYRTCPLFH
jgi:hypothetical protein